MPSSSRPIFRRIIQIAAVLLSLSMAAFYVVRSQRSANNHQKNTSKEDEFTVVQSTKRSGSIAITSDNIDNLLKGPAAADVKSSKPSEPDLIDIDPKHLERFEGFIDYGTPIPTEATDANGNTTTIILGTKSISQPIFSTRKLRENENENRQATPVETPTVTVPSASPSTPQPPPP